MKNASENSKIAIVLLNWNGKKDTLECLSSLEKITYPNLEIIIVDNGSSDGSLITIKEAFPHVLFVETFHNLGYAGGNNVGIDHALKRGADFVLLLNNDTIVDPQFLTAFMQGAKEKPNAGIFGAKVFRYKDPEVLDHMGGHWNPKICEFESLSYGKKDPGTLQEMIPVDYVCGCAIMIKKEVVEHIGKLDTQFFLLWEETDFCARARRAGFEIWLVPQAMIWHKVSASFSGKALMQYYWWRNRLLWIERNCTRKEKISLYLRVILKEMLQIYKLNALKSLQHWVLKHLFPKKITEKKLYTLKRYKAGCKGIRDYFLRRFGGPVTI